MSRLGFCLVGLNEDSFGRTRVDSLRHCGFAKNLASLAHQVT